MANGFTVKTIKGKKYVYKQETVNGKQVETYLGSENSEKARTYIKAQNGTAKSFRIIGKIMYLARSLERDFGYTVDVSLPMAEYDKNGNRVYGSSGREIQIHIRIFKYGKCKVCGEPMPSPDPKSCSVCGGEEVS